MVHEQWTRRHLWMLSPEQTEYDSVGAMIRLLRQALEIFKTPGYLPPASAYRWEIEAEELLKEGGPDES